MSRTDNLIIDKMTARPHTPTPFVGRFVEGGYRRKERYEIRTTTRGIGEPVALIVSATPRDDQLFFLRACNNHDSMKANIEDARWLFRELLSRCNNEEWRARIEAQIGASDTVLTLLDKGEV